MTPTRRQIPGNDVSLRVLIAAGTLPLAHFLFHLKYFFVSSQITACTLFVSSQIAPAVAPHWAPWQTATALYSMWTRIIPGFHHSILNLQWRYLILQLWGQETVTCPSTAVALALLKRKWRKMVPKRGDEVFTSVLLLPWHPCTQVMPNRATLAKQGVLMTTTLSR